MIANLAVELSDLEKHVLLIDFDMQNPAWDLVSEKCGL